MNDQDIARIASEVSLLMQLDRMRHKVGTELDMKALGNVSHYIASVFEKANEASGELSPRQAYDLVNRRVSRLEAHLYLMRLELENRFERDPARVFEDPLAISAYGERMDTLTRVERRFSFESSILAYGWYPIEFSEGQSFRWMRHGEVSVACIPHLGALDQTVEIFGSVLLPEQIDGLRVSTGTTQAVIQRIDDNPVRFCARFDLAGKDVKSANFLPIEFRISRFLQPNDLDTRLLGACVDLFACRPVATPQPQDPAIPAAAE